jgi:hypothetical protein
VKTEARTVFRREVAQAARQGEVVVVPLLLSAGGVEGEVKATCAAWPTLRAAPDAAPQHLALGRDAAEALLAQRGTTALGQGLASQIAGYNIQHE